MSHTVTTETTTFTRTRYFCDIDGKELLQGQKPVQCFGCGRDLCTEHCVDAYFPTEHKNCGDKTLCQPCLDLYDAKYFAALSDISKRFSQERDAVLQAFWAEARAQHSETPTSSSAAAPATLQV